MNRKVSMVAAMISTAFFILQAPEPAAAQQRQRPTVEIEKTSGRLGREVAPIFSGVVDSQLHYFGKVMVKYSSEDTVSLIWCDDRIWWDLYRSRVGLAAQLTEIDRSEQSRSRVWELRTRMEREALWLLATDEINLMASELELTDDQFPKFMAAVRQDAKRKHQALKTYATNNTPERFLDDLRQISTETEATLLKLLSPAQQESYAEIKLDTPGQALS